MPAELFWRARVVHRQGGLLGYQTCFQEQRAPISTECQAGASGAVVCGLVSYVCQMREARLLPVSQNKVWCRAVLCRTAVWWNGRLLCCSVHCLALDLLVWWVYTE